MSRTPLETILNKKKRRTIGLMSGTSADGVDVALCEVNLEDHGFQTVWAKTVQYPEPLRERVLKTAHSGTVDLRELVALSTHLGHFFADCVKGCCHAHDFPLSQLDLVGSHGQTVAHLSQPYPFLNGQYRGTLQLGEAEIIAKRLGVVTVSDFRSGDIAVGGSGAPLVPIYHQFRFAQADSFRVVLNIGGIANATLLKGTTECLATDTGPGNCLIDHAMQKLYGRPCDEGGAVALAGRIDEELLRLLEGDGSLMRTLPTTYDRKELADLLSRHGLLALSPSIHREGIVSTLSELTVRTIYSSIEGLAAHDQPELLLVCGGGVHNKYIMTRLRDYLKGASVVSTAEHGVDPKFVEAEAFAYLANLTLAGLSGNLRQVTGAQRRAVLGKISQP